MCSQCCASPCEKCFCSEGACGLCQGQDPRGQPCVGRASGSDPVWLWRGGQVSRARALRGGFGPRIPLFAYSGGWEQGPEGRRPAGSGVWATQDSRVGSFELAALRTERGLPAAGSLGVLSPHTGTPSRTVPAGREGSRAQLCSRPSIQPGLAPTEFPKVG